MSSRHALSDHGGGGAIDLTFPSPFRSRAWQRGWFETKTFFREAPKPRPKPLSPMAHDLLSRLRANTGIWKGLHADELDALAELRGRLTIEAKPWVLGQAPHAIMVRLP